MPLLMRDSDDSTIISLLVTRMMPGTDAANDSAAAKSSLLGTFPSSVTSRAADTKTLTPARRRLGDGAAFNFSSITFSILTRRTDWYFWYPPPATNTDANPNAIIGTTCFQPNL